MKKVLFLVFLFVICFMGMDGVRASAGIECFYSSDDYIKENFKASGGNNQSANDKDEFVKDPAVCGLVAWQNNDGIYETYAYCETARGNELIWPKNYDSKFGKKKSLDKFGYNNGEVSSCPESISFSKNTFITAPTNDKLDVGEFKFGGIGMSLTNSTTIASKSKNAPDTKSKVKKMLEGKESSLGSTYYGVPGNANDDDHTIDNTSFIGMIQSFFTKQDNENPSNPHSLEDTNCSSLLSGGLDEILRTVFFIISVVGVIILLFTTATDFIKAIASSDNDAISKAFKSSKTRIIAAIILLILPFLVSFIINLINENFVVVTDKNSNTTKVEIGDPSKCNIVS